jgi:hypothetical protein
MAAPFPWPSMIRHFAAAQGGWRHTGGVCASAFFDFRFSIFDGAKQNPNCNSLLAGACGVNVEWLLDGIRALRGTKSTHVLGTGDMFRKLARNVSGTSKERPAEQASERGPFLTGNSHEEPPPPFLAFLAASRPASNTSCVLRCAAHYERLGALGGPGVYGRVAT